MKKYINIAKVITMYASESCSDIIEHLNIQLLPESYIEYAEKYIKKIEDNIKKLKKILENKTISELIYR